MIPIPASILAIENESDRDFMENIFFSYQRLIYHEIGSILNDPWSKDDIFQTVIVQLINNIDTLRPMPAKVLTSYIATSARNAALTTHQFPRPLYHRGKGKQSIRSIRKHSDVLKYCFSCRVKQAL